MSKLINLAALVGLLVLVTSSNAAKSTARHEELQQAITHHFHADETLDLDLTDLAGYRELDVHGLRTRWAR